MPCMLISGSYRGQHEPLWGIDVQPAAFCETGPSLIKRLPCICLLSLYTHSIVCKITSAMREEPSPHYKKT